MRFSRSPSFRSAACDILLIDRTHTFWCSGEGADATKNSRRTLLFTQKQFGLRYSLSAKADTFVRAMLMRPLSLYLAVDRYLVAGFTL